MHDTDSIAQYNYAEFSRASVGPLMQFSESPPIGSRAPSFPLWRLDGTETTLAEVWSQHVYTAIEFGSFT